jgi:hypothetical protein
VGDFSMFDEKGGVLVGWVTEHTSENGSKYFTGRFGASRLIIVCDGGRGADGGRLYRMYATPKFRDIPRNARMQPDETEG